MPAVSSSAMLVCHTQSLVDVVVDHVRGCITSESLRIGDKLPTESALMEVLDANHMVVREAISRLQAKGLTETRYDIGGFVLPSRIDNSIPLGDVLTVYKILSTLGLCVTAGTECVGLAAQRVSAAEIKVLCPALEATEQDQVEGNDSATFDLQLRLSIIRATDNKHFMSALTQLGKTLIPCMRMGPAQVGYLNVPELHATVSHEYHSVFEAITRKDSEAACVAMRMYLSSGRKHLRRAYEAAGTQTTAADS